MLRAIAINKNIYNKPLDSPQRQEVNIQLYLPPTDVPQYVSGCYNDSEDSFVITFSYQNTENESELFDKDNIKFLIGTSSGKPLRIEIKNIKKEKVDTIRLSQIIRDDISKLIEQTIGRQQTPRAVANLKCAEAVLKGTADELARVPALC